MPVHSWPMPRPMAGNGVLAKAPAAVELGKRGGTDASRQRRSGMDEATRPDVPPASIEPAPEGAARAVPFRDLRRRCDADLFRFGTTAELEALPELFGQERAKQAIELGIGVRRDGYNLFVLGPAGGGKHTLLRRLVEQAAATGESPPDWCYVFDFERPHEPQALQLPAGAGARLRDGMRRLVDDLLGAIPAAFDSDEYRAKLEAIDTEFSQRHETALRELAQAADQQEIALVRTPTGFTLAAVKNGEVLGADEFAALDKERREKIEAAIASLQQRLEQLARDAHHWHHERRERMRALNREVASYSVNLALTELRRSFSELPAVQKYLATVEQNLVDNAEDFRAAPDAPAAVMVDGAPGSRAAALRRYSVNLLVAQDGHAGAPVVSEEHPTHQNLLGRIEHTAQLGALVTDFTLIKPGALHRANGGYLLLDAHKLLAQPFAWEALKRALTTRRLRMESLGQLYGLVSTASLEPEPIALDVKVILFGERLWYHLLFALDPDFARLFKVAVDFDDDIERNAENQELLARLIATVARRDGLASLDRSAVAHLIEESARSVGDSERLSMHVGSLRDLLVETDFYARRDGAAVADASHVDAAIAAQVRRADRMDQRLRQEILRDTVLIDTEGERVGQVNALAAYSVGARLFARPVRITATTRVGDGEVVDVQREIQRGGPIHSKGVFILASFLASRFSATRPHALRASLVFEQTYDEVEGDSASAAELCALLSSIAALPIRQSVAITGSVNQYGQLQPIGAVNAKIEGFFDICSARGLTGNHGVVIPSGNVKHLMLRDDVVRAAERGLFRVYAAESIDEAIAVLTGVVAGTQRASGDYPPDSLNGRVAQRLREFSKLPEVIAGALAAARRRRGPVRLRD